MKKRMTKIKKTLLTVVFAAGLLFVGVTGAVTVHYIVKISA